MISVCMPYRERQEALDLSLENYEKHYDPDDVEIWICDDGSPRPCEVYASKIQTFVTRLPKRSTRLNPCVPINKAVNLSCGEYIYLTNPENIHEKPVLYQMRDSIKKWNDYVIGAVWSKARNQWLSRSDHIGKGWMPIPPGSGMHFSVMFTRKLWEKAGGFDEDYREGSGCDDNDWAWRAWKAGANFIYRDDLVTYDVKTPKTAWSKPLHVNRNLLHEKWSDTWKSLNLS